MIDHQAKRMRKFAAVFRFPIILLFSICFSQLIGQNQVTVYHTVRTNQIPIIDGDLQDSCWIQAEQAGAFTQTQPNPGKASRKETDVRMVYDDEAIYIAAHLYDSAPDSILHQLGARDDYQNNNADHFGIILDTYHDRRNAFFFLVTAAGVQSDARYTLDKTDMSLNAVWYSKTKITNDGWVVEMKIPYQAIRFPKESVQNWGINFLRSIRRFREVSYWNPVDPAVQGIVNQSGDLNGMQDIISPVRLALLPYVSGYVENFNSKTGYSFNGGMDVKYGLNESFTLDMTLIPDFGQTQSDNLVLNLSPFEVKFDERRYFFTEGTELFNKNDLFYSRRIGARPSGYTTLNAQLMPNEMVTDNPATTRLYNAVKISGRTPHKLGLGFLNAVGTPTYATITDTITGATREIQTEQLANYNVLVVDQILRHNSYIGFLNTNVMRNGSARDANVSSIQFRVADEKNKYAVDGHADLSLIYLTGTQTPSTGYRYNFNAGKISGRYLIAAKYAVVSEKFDPTDLGFQERNNIETYSLVQNYNIYKPFWKLNSTFNTVEMNLSVLHTLHHYSFFSITGRHFFTTRKFHSFGFNWLMNPIDGYDYFEARVPNRYIIYPKNFDEGLFLSTDYRKVFALDASVNYRIFLERNRRIFKYVLAPRWRPNNKLFLVYRWEHELKTDNVGYVRYRNDSLFFGVRDLNTVTSTLTMTYIFTNRMGLSFRARHYWSQAEYSSYFLVNENGKVEDAYYNGDSNVSFNTFNIDMVFTWQFRPGSELSIVWKNAIISSSSVLQPDYVQDVRSVFDSPQSNSISAKLIWFIDAGPWFKKK
jgi:Domain of unknown function (DUF5916)/Carbohydrate family 9 binding domain-like